MIVLGIDPGTLITGYGVIERGRGRTRLLGCGTIRNDSRQPLARRLKIIYTGICEVIDQFHPSECAIESAFYGKNAQSALKLGHARGVSMLAAVEQDIPTSEYSPREVKKAIVGKGNASKEQVQFMVKRLLNLSDMRMPVDASDAIAIALCHLQRSGGGAVKSRDWKSYIAEHPERVTS
jgi:crossover junction endodeoxyribonuclease RuvC